MLTLPHAVSLTGIRAGVPLIVCYTLISMWTVHLLNALYLEYKRSKVTLPTPMPCHVPGITAHPLVAWQAQCVLKAHLSARVNMPTTADQKTVKKAHDLTVACRFRLASGTPAMARLGVRLASTLR